MKPYVVSILLCCVVLGGCSSPAGKEAKVTPKPSPPPVYYKVDPVTSGIVTGIVKFKGRRPHPKPIDMSDDPACVEAHHGEAYDESVVVDHKGNLANVFIYIKSGLEGKKFETPVQPVTIDQRGCWFNPRVIGIQIGQPLKVINSDPVTHNIHPLAQINREWNHSQGAQAILRSSEGF